MRRLNFKFCGLKFIRGVIFDSVLAGSTVEALSRLLRSKNRKLMADCLSTVIPLSLHRWPEALFVVMALFIESNLISPGTLHRLWLVIIVNDKVIRFSAGHLF